MTPRDAVSTSQPLLIMKLLELIYRRETRMPMVALTFATATAVALVLARVLFTGNLKYGLLVGNLALAWIPLLLALLAQKHFETDGWRQWRFAALATGWLLFFPNAPYIFTDVVHVFRGSFRNFWADLTLIFIFGLTGLVLGFLSLYLMHSLARRAWGQWRGWSRRASAGACRSAPHRPRHRPTA